MTEKWFGGNTFELMAISFPTSFNGLTWTENFNLEKGGGDNTDERMSEEWRVKILRLYLEMFGNTTTLSIFSIHRLWENVFADLEKLNFWNLN